MGTTTSAAPQQSGQVMSLAQLRAAGVHKQTGREAGGTNVEAFFKANRDNMAAMLPRHMDADRMVKIALRCLRVTPGLMECTLESLMAGIITCSGLGLEPNTPLGHAYLLPFKGRRKVRGQWQSFTDVQVIVGYKGMIDLARRSGQIVSISTHVVREGDTFDLSYGVEENLIHKPKLDGAPGRVFGAYAVAKLKGGGAQFEFMTLAELNAIRDASQGYISAKKAEEEYGKASKTPWITNEDQMYRKTTLRRLFNMLPISIEMANALAIDDRASAGEAQGLEKVLEGVDYSEVPYDAGDAEGEAHDPETGEVSADDPAVPKQVAHEQNAGGLALDQTAASASVANELPLTDDGFPKDVAAQIDAAAARNAARARKVEG